MLRDSGIHSINPWDGHRIEVVATGLPLYGGVPLAIDCTLVSPLNRQGEPHRHAAEVLQAAEEDKAKTYRELVSSDMLRFVVAATEVGGRQTVSGKLLVQAAAAKRTRDEPALLRAAVFRAMHTRGPR